MMVSAEDYPVPEWGVWRREYDDMGGEAVSLQAAAIAAAQGGRSVIPIGPCSKIPAIPWKKYQYESARPEQVMKWWRGNSRYNLGIVTGLVSGLSVADYDPRTDATGETLAWLKTFLQEPNVRTGGGGFHWYMKAASASIPKLMPGLDWKSEGGYVLAPPSITSGIYLQLRTDLYPMPSELRELVKRGRERVTCANRKQENKDPQTMQDGGLRLEDVLGLLVAVRSTRTGWLARCPAHDDHSPSLSVGEGRDGRPLLRCWVGCSFSDVMAAIRDKHSRSLVAMAAALNLK